MKGGVVGGGEGKRVGKSGGKIREGRRWKGKEGKARETKRAEKEKSPRAEKIQGRGHRALQRKHERKEGIGGKIGRRERKATGREGTKETKRLPRAPYPIQTVVRAGEVGGKRGGSKNRVRDMLVPDRRPL